MAPRLISAAYTQRASTGSGRPVGMLQQPIHSVPKWYFSREEIEKESPSRVDGITLKEESNLRRSYCGFLRILALRLKIPLLTTATAIVFCHRFYIRQSHLKNDHYTVATSCMFLAGKVEETPVSLAHVTSMAYEIRHEDSGAVLQYSGNLYNKEMELVLVGERLVLDTLGFDLNIDLPFKPLMAAIQRFSIPDFRRLEQVAWSFVNNELQTTLYLQFNAHEIAAGAIFLAAKFLEIKLPTHREEVWWQELQVSRRQLEEVSNQFGELYTTPDKTQGRSLVRLISSGLVRLISPKLQNCFGG